LNHSFIAFLLSKEKRKNIGKITKLEKNYCSDVSGTKNFGPCQVGLDIFGLGLVLENIP